MTGGWSEELTYSYLHRLLNAVTERFDLRLLRDAEGDPQAPCAVLRHDVDVCLKPAVALAEREADWGVRATYLVQVDCPLYRLDDDAGQTALAKIAELGHEIGLHVDVELAARGGPAAIERRVGEAASVLASMTGAAVQTVSFHRPSPDLIRGPERVAGMINAYARPLMARYLSDSEGRWREGEPLAQVESTQSRFLQLLVHPIWWAEDHLSPGDRLQRFFEARARAMTTAEIELFDRELLRAVGPAQRTGRT